MTDYFGTYADFETESKKAASVLLNADTMVGDVLTVECTMDEGDHRAWLINQFDKRIGYFNRDVSKTLSLQKARGLTIRAILAFTAFTDTPDEGHYWGQVALVCYPPAHEQPFERFINHVSEALGEGNRPNVDLGNDSIKQIVASDGEWMPKKMVPMPEKAKGTAILKRRKTFNDRIITQGRAGNKGCYVVSWIFLLVLVALIMFGLYSCFFQPS